MIKVTPLDPFPPNSNPYHYDRFNMGTSIGSNVEVMAANHETRECKSLIVVNKTTGERVRLSFVEPEDERAERLCEAIMNLPDIQVGVGNNDGYKMPAPVGTYVRQPDEKG